MVRDAAISGALLIFLLAGVPSFATAEDEPPPPEQPSSPIQKLDIEVNPASKARIKFESDTFDFGSVPRGALVVHSFKFTNSGTDTLEITSVRPTCGCTTAPLSSNKIAPGAEATIKANFNSKNITGRVVKYIYVNSTDPINPYLKLSFKATINDPLIPINPNPLEADFGSVKVGAAGDLKVTLSNTGEAAYEVKLVDESAPAAVKISPVSINLNSWGNAELTLHLAPQDKAVDLKESITFEISGGKDGRFTLPWKAVIAEQVQ
jgi:hypothetical protein